jgi:hypothetical protein
MVTGISSLLSLSRLPACLPAWTDNRWKALKTPVLEKRGVNNSSMLCPLAHAPERDRREQPAHKNQERSQRTVR